MIQNDMDRSELYKTTLLLFCYGVFNQAELLANIIHFRPDLMEYLQLVDGR